MDKRGPQGAVETWAPEPLVPTPRSQRPGPVRRRRIVREPRRFLLYRGEALVAEGVEFSSGGVTACQLADGLTLSFENLATFLVIQRRRGVDPTVRFLDELRREPLEVADARAAQ